LIEITVPLTNWSLESLMKAMLSISTLAGIVR
jgi:hypothetical protein